MASISKGAESMKQWVSHGKGGIDSLKLEEIAIPKPGENEVLVKIHAVSLNYRDLMILTGTYDFERLESVVPVSDGAGEVISIGAKVRRFKPGQRVIPTFSPFYISGNPTVQDIAAALGSSADGVLQEYVIVNEAGLVHIPSILSYEEASTLPCAGVTAWNSLYGSRSLRPGDTVLTQGTGGVSIFALQFALAGGAETIATTSSKEKELWLKKFGAHHVINYKEDPNWGETARQLSLDQQGVNYVIEIGGPRTMQQASKAAALGGEVSIIGRRSVETGNQDVSRWDPHLAGHGTRRILVGSRMQFEEMNRAIQVNKIRPVIDKTFNFAEAKDAFQYLWDQKHMGKIVIKVADISS